MSAPLALPRLVDVPRNAGEFSRVFGRPVLCFVGTFEWGLYLNVPAGMGFGTAYDITNATGTDGKAQYYNPTGQGFQATAQANRPPPFWVVWAGGNVSDSWELWGALDAQPGTNYQPIATFSGAYGRVPVPRPYWQFLKVKRIAGPGTPTISYSL